MVVVAADENLAGCDVLLYGRPLRQVECAEK